MRYGSFRRIVALAFCLAALTVKAAPADDLVTTLPLFPTSSVLPKSYAGYLEAKGGVKQMFYWLFTPTSGVDPTTLIVWFTGGPGCSSLFAEVTEQGPIQVTQGSNGPSVFLKPINWAENYAIAFIESPCGVGFSYATDHNYTTGDDIAA